MYDENGAWSGEGACNGSSSQSHDGTYPVNPGLPEKKDHSIFNVEHRYILVLVADNGDQGRPLDELVE